MKKKNACALYVGGKDFDTTRILSRPFFKSLNLPEGDDESIISGFNTDNCSTTAEMEERIARLLEVKAGVRKFGDLLIKQQVNRHIKLLDKFDKLMRKIFEPEDDFDETDFAAIKLTPDFKPIVLERLKSYLKKINILHTQYQAAGNAVTNLLDRIIKQHRVMEKAIQKEYRVHFAQNLKAARAAKGITQKAAAAMLGVAVPTFSDYERGEAAPSYRNLARISDMLGTSIDDLIKH